MNKFNVDEEVIAIKYYYSFANKGTILTISNFKIFDDGVKCYGFKEIDDGDINWLYVENFFISVNYFRKQKLKKILKND